MCSSVEPCFNVSVCGARLLSGVAGHGEGDVALLGVGGEVDTLIADGVDGGEVLGLCAGCLAGAGGGGGEADEAGEADESGQAGRGGQAGGAADGGACGGAAGRRGSWTRLGCDGCGAWGA